MAKNLIQNRDSRLPPTSIVVFGIVGVMVLVVTRMELRRLNPEDPIWEHYRTFKWWLLPHAIACGLTLLLGPVQFSQGFRRRYSRWHRRCGWIYVCGVLIGAPLGLWIEYVKYRGGIGSLPMVVATSGFAGLFLGTTSVALVLAIRRRFEAHRRWMIRSYATAMIFLETRTVDELPWLTKITD